MGEEISNRRRYVFVWFARLLQRRKRRAIKEDCGGLVDQRLVHVDFPNVMCTELVIVKQAIGDAAGVVGDEAHAASMWHQWHHCQRARSERTHAEASKMEASDLDLRDQVCVTVVDSSNASSTAYSSLLTPSVDFSALSLN